ncbi:PREDICTED: uncharacterized protein LOC104721889 [Camelina sativa]|uniref:Uncharacterized protein LOC104721889 n=1 Tax=Camelina sativa TaxID=90675 RepID=A0ABM0UAD9_CAMSA|nr:PREDICTED: uncharacterized protein LOC104721889 [Camelina sativa]
MALATSCHPECKRALNAQEDYDASQSAALVAANLISAARVILKLDTEYTSYSAQFLVDNACPKKEDGQSCELTVKDALAFALKEGLPKEVVWAHLGCMFKPPPSACRIPRVSMKEEVVEAKDLDGAFKLLVHQPVGAKLHVFSPQIDCVGEEVPLFACQIPRVPMKGEVIEATNWDEALELAMQQPVGARLHVFSPEFDRRFGEKGIYDGPSGKGTRYVGLRDVIVVEAARIKGKDVATVQICYKKKTSFVKVAVKSRSLRFNGGDKSQRTSLLVDFCMPRFSIN